MGSCHPNNNRVPVSVLEANLTYDPRTGELRWKDRPWLRGSINARTRFKRAGTRSDGYIRLTLTYQGKEIRMLGHRIAWALHYGYWPEEEVDHEDRDGFNNALDNLRLASSTDNKVNRVQEVGMSGYRGVYYDRRRGTIFGRVTRAGQTIYLGNFPDEASAARAYDAAALKFQGEYALTNSALGLL